MPNGLRHVLGLIAGLVLAPAVAVGLFYGTERMVRAFQVYFFHSGAQWVPLAVLTAVGVTLGVLAGSRISPLASLVPGLLFAAVGGLWALTPTWMARHTARELPDSLDRGYQVVGPYGVMLVLGLLLLVASLPPSRWRAREPRHAARHTDEYGTAGQRPDRAGQPDVFRPPGLQSPQDARPLSYRGQGSAGPVPGRPGPAPGYRSREDQDPPDWASPPPGPPPFRP
ncbi:hypothetical protein ACRYCC_02125 [Actinomadura scrupuli]|uniref:hypothetical protein n=1 Tax=Actinomadura scrupuli TaxID=559629 RepID=UPI003D98D6F7